jgi:hypothetical protein
MLSDGEILSLLVETHQTGRRHCTLSLSDDGVFIPARFAKEMAASATLYPCSTTPLSLFSGEFKSTYCDHHCQTASRMGAEFPKTGTIDGQLLLLLLIGHLGDSPIRFRNLDSQFHHLTCCKVPQVFAGLQL